MNITLEIAKQLFIDDQELRGNSPETIKFYSRNINYLIEFIGKNKFIRDIQLQDLQDYLIELRTRNKKHNDYFKPKIESKVKSISIQSYVRAIRVFMRWMHGEGYIVENLAEQFKLPKATKKVIEILSDEEIKVLMQSMNQNTEMGVRNSCIVALMLDCGLRRSEVLDLDYDKLHLNQGVLKALGKGDKERIVPVGLYTKKILHKYINGYRSMPEYDTKKLFLDVQLKPMTDTAMKQLFVRLKAKTKIERLHPHLLRHTFATKYLMNGGDIFSLQQILGHTSIEMVRRYSHLASSYLVYQHKRFSPLDNIEMSKYR